ncbi:MAG TPA: cobalt ECF transporter T component CbiQ [Bacteroidales bacterium]|nr:cobalt ECF transporter T component CbiQ [Bacteroidales bacterium]HBZ19531.1 cobalt ECF transporter T component CbiQ [Bacteroidales bacterium]
MKNSIPEYLLQASLPGPIKRKGVKITFLDKTVLNTAKAVKSIYLQAENSDTENFIRKISPNVKLLSLIYFVVVISIANNLLAQTVTSVFILTLFAAARLRISEVFRKILFLAFIFGFIVVIPASLNVITPGRIVFSVIKLNNPLHFWIYNVPQNIGVTDNGIKVVSLIFLRVLNSISCAMLIVFTTPFPSLVKAFKIIGVPDTFLMIISLAYKYIFILCRIIEETYFALKSRLCGNIKNNNIRKLIGGRIFFIYKRSHIIYEGTYLAMVSRGYSGRFNLSVGNHLTRWDIVSLFVIAAIGIAIILI